MQAATSVVNTIKQYIVANTLPIAALAVTAIGITYAINHPQTVAKIRRGVTSATKAAQRMKNARNLGQQGEKAANIVKNTERIRSITNTAKYRIPDALDHSNKVLTEIKNVKYQGLTNQLKDFNLWAEKNSYDFVLKTRPDTKISGPLQEYIDSGKIIHLFIGN